MELWSKLEDNKKEIGNHTHLQHWLETDERASKLLLSILRRCPVIFCKKVIWLTWGAGADQGKSRMDLQKKICETSPRTPNPQITLLLLQVSPSNFHLTHHVGSLSFRMSALSTRLWISLQHNSFSSAMVDSVRMNCLRHYSRVSSYSGSCCSFSLSRISTLFL